MTRRFHISVSVTDYDGSVRDYTERLGSVPVTSVKNRYALWRTDLLNFSISCKPGQSAGIVRHIGFEDSAEQTFREEQDINGITWEYFNEAAQQSEIDKLVAEFKPA